MRVRARVRVRVRMRVRVRARARAKVRVREQLERLGLLEVAADEGLELDLGQQVRLGRGDNQVG